jgi:cell division protein FtsW
MRNYAARRRPLLRNGETTRRHRPDYILLILCALLLGIGLIVVFAISPGLSAQQNVSENYYVGKQLVAILLGIAAFVIVSNLPLRIWRRLEMPLLIMAGVASIAVRLFGDQVNGAYRWIQIGGLSFQAAELIKFALLIWLAGFLSDRIRTGTLTQTNKTLRPLLILLGLIGVVVAILQKDFGSTGVMVAMIAVMTYIAGLPMKRIIMIACVAVVGMTLVILPFSYRRQRLANFLEPTRDCQNTGYQACQALIAVGSGGIFGLGLAHSVQAYGYLPEAENDSIFAIFAEKFGFLGTTILIGLFVALFARIGKIMERAPDDYSRLIVAGVLAWLSTQAIINIGAMIGLLPLKGITLPFISYGGTSLIFVTAAIGIVFNISRYTTYSANTNTIEGQNRDYSTSRRGERRSYYATSSRSPRA